MFERSLSTLEALPALVGYLDCDLRICFVNDAQRVWQGRSPDEIIGKYVWDLVGPDLREITERKMREALAGAHVEHEFDVIVRGQPRCFRVSYAPDLDEEGEVVGIITLTTDLTERRKIEQLLRNSQRTFDGAFRNAVIGKAIVDLDGCCSRVNEALATMLGYAADELTGVNFRDITHPDDLEADLSMFRSMMNGDGDGYQLEKRYLHRNGNTVHALLSVSVVRDDDGLPLQFVSEVVDITERKVEHDLVNKQALTDPLTGLLNRRGFDGAVAGALAQPDAGSKGLGILVIDLDRFKPVNDQFGHAAGDALLVESAARLLQTVRCADKVARIGGDEFAVLLIGCSQRKAAVAADRVVKVLAKPFEIEGATITIGASAGAVFSDDGINDLAQWLRQADGELYKAKGAGRGCWRVARIAA